ncbi:Glycosyl hydrolase 53-domain-containing protein [Mycena venus]|uniref:Glycosyl hydrolase 53-domain-containing protein n=1 Tax=Mycena venus TaxID=2733690 RepID=A0A8H6YI89_9AGAR|nr:Glycosyl hydrolase 53-domain-containing protein [Mycena venus]
MLSPSTRLALVLCSCTVLVAGTKLPKRGLSFDIHDSFAVSDLLKANQTDGAASWVYNWGPVPPEYLTDSGLEFVPMQWNAVGIENLATTVKSIGAKNVLAFNEPDMVGQSNINPTDAATLWMKYFEPLKATGVRLGAPAVSSGDAGMAWLGEFMTACAKCTIDFIPFHWYGMGAENFYSYLYEFNQKFPEHPLWITEFADTTPTDTAMVAFMNATLTSLSGHPLDEIDFVERYAWFAYNRTDNDGHNYHLLDAAGNLNAAGKMYALSAATDSVSSPQSSGPENTSSHPTSSGGGNVATQNTASLATSSASNSPSTSPPKNTGLRSSGSLVDALYLVGGTIIIAVVSASGATLV